MIRINSLLTHPVARYASSTRPALLALHRISLCCSVRGVIEPPRSVRMTAEAHLALRIQRRWNEPHWWSGGGTECTQMISTGFPACERRARARVFTREALYFEMRVVREETTSRARQSFHPAQKTFPLAN